MDGQLDPEQAHHAGRVVSWAVVVVGVGQGLAWSSVGYWLSSSDADALLDGSASVGATPSLLALGAAVVAALLAGALGAARVVRCRRPWVTAWLSILAVAAALLVAITVAASYDGMRELVGAGGTWRTPAIGGALGAQLAVLLPGSSLRQAVRRFGTPVLVDLIAAVVAEPFEAETELGALALAISWFALALATVAWMERAALAREAVLPPAGHDLPV